MNNKPRNYSGLFNLFAHDKPDKTGTILQTIGKISFTISFALTAISIFIKDDASHRGLLNIMLAVYGIGYFVGIFMFIATGIHYSGRENGNTSFLSSSAHVLKNTFLYLFLPVIIITILIILWAIITKQPAFQ